MTLIRETITLYESAVIQGHSYFHITTRTLGNGEVLEFTITAPVAPPATIGLAFSAEPVGQLQIEAFRGATLNATPAGTILPLFNANEASGNVSATVIREAPTIDDDGVLVATRTLGAGKKNEISSGSDSNVITLAKESGTTLIRLTSSTSSNLANVEFRIIDSGA